MSHRETERKDRARKALFSAITELGKRHQFVSLDITLSPANIRADIRGRFFKYRHEGAAWKEPHDVHFTVVSDPESGTARINDFIPRRLNKQEGGIKEHVGVRERGYPKHSKL